MLRKAEVGKLFDGHGWTGMFLSAFVSIFAQISLLTVYVSQLLGVSGLHSDGVWA